MKKIKIFLASSIVEFSNERMILENFIRNVSDKFEEAYDVKIQPLLCENFDDAYTVARKQEEYNEKIRESELCFFIFFTKAGKYTREEFYVAREQFEKTGSPKIYTYFKVIEEGSGEEDLYAFMEELDKILGHYYGTFSHIDTIKLRILLSIKLREMNFLEIKSENGECVVDGTKIMSLENVAEFANNEQLKKLFKELEQVEEEYYKLKPQYEKKHNDADFYKKYSAVASRRQYLIDEIEELQKLIFNVSLRMVEDDTHGSVTERQKRAYRLFEQGDYEGCMSVLDSNDIDSDFFRDMQRLENQKITVCRKYIREHKTAIDILRSMREYDKRFEEIEERYRKIIQYILELKIETDTAAEYVSYLIDQGKDDVALPVAQQLAGICEDESKQVRVYGLLGILCHHLNKPTKAEEYLLKAIAIGEKSADENPVRVNPALARSYNNAGVFYKIQGDATKAEKYYLKAIAISEKLADENPDRFNPDLATSFNNASNFYKDQGDATKAEEYYLKAMAIREKLAEKTPDRFNPDLAASYICVGNFYADRGDATKAEEYYLKAIAISEKLAYENPDRFSPDLATSCNNAGVFYANRGNTAKAEEYYLKAIAIREKLAEKNPDRFNPDLAASCICAGNFYAARGDATKAEEYYLKAIAISEKLAYENPDRFNPDLAISCNNAGIFYANRGDTAKAEEYYLKAIAIREKLADENPRRFNPVLAGSYFNYGIFEKDNEMLEKALELAKTRPDHPICKKIIAVLGFKN